MDAVGAFGDYFSDAVDDFGQTGAGTMLGLGGKPKTQEELDAEAAKERFEDLPDLSATNMANIEDLFSADQVFIDRDAQDRATADAMAKQQADAAAAQNALI
jgi:hypothetical protein